MALVRGMDALPKINVGMCDKLFGECLHAGPGRYKLCIDCRAGSYFLGNFVEIHWSDQKFSFSGTEQWVLSTTLTK